MHSNFNLVDFADDGEEGGEESGEDKDDDADNDGKFYSQIILRIKVLCHFYLR